MRNAALRAADLCKADLTTEMVGEFPELQGTMARLYAHADNEDAGVAKALEEHYWPITLTGKLPSTPIAAVVAVADKMDTLAGDFAVGLIPSGFGGSLRAAPRRRRCFSHSGSPAVAVAFGMADRSSAHMPAQRRSVVTQRDKTRQDLLQFMRQRFAAVLEERGFAFDEIEAVLTLQIGGVHEALARLKALHDIRARPEFGSAVQFVQTRRKYCPTGQSPRKAAWRWPITPITACGWNSFKIRRNKRFSKPFSDPHQNLERHLQGGAYGPALESMVTLRDPLDQFFKGVMVMAEDSSLRANRLALLSGIVHLFLRIADFSKLQNA